MKLVSISFFLPQVLWTCSSFSVPNTNSQREAHVSLRAESGRGFFDVLENIFPGSKRTTSRQCRARDLVKDFVEEMKCFSSVNGAKAFSEACSSNVVYEDTFEKEPFVGRKVCSRIVKESLCHIVC